MCDYSHKVFNWQGYMYMGVVGVGQSPCGAAEDPVVELAQAWSFSAMFLGKGKRAHAALQLSFRSKRQTRRAGWPGRRPRGKAVWRVQPG